MTKFIEHRANRRAASKSTVVLYHAECTDGFGAAWAAYKKFGSDADYFAVEHQYLVPDGLTGKAVYLLDFTYPQETMDMLASKNTRVTSIDHHVSVADVTRSTKEGVYDNEHSGAVLAWRYFHSDEPIPYLLRVIEDNDLHRFALEETEVLTDWLDQYDFEFKVYDRLAEQLEDTEGRKRALAEGQFLMRFRHKLVERMLANTSYEAMFEGHRAGIVNTELFHSEVATALAERFDIGVAWRVRPHGVYVSLRSEDKVNVAELATHYGGGGHANSAGFVVHDVSDLPFERIEVENGDANG